MRNCYHFHRFYYIPWIGILLWSTSLLFRAANAVKGSTSGNKVVESIQDDLSFDDNGKLASHYLIYPIEQQNQSNCYDIKNRKTYGVETVPVSGQAQVEFFPNMPKKNDPNRCLASCLERGTDRKVVHAVMQYRQYDSSIVQQPFHTWYNDNCARIEICITNYYDKIDPIRIYWLPKKQPMVYQTDVYYGNKHIDCIYSFLGDRFQITDSHHTIVDTFTVEYHTSKVYGTSPPSDNPHNRNFDQEIHDSLHGSWELHHKFNRTFSALGFSKGRLPDDIFASMGSYYYNNRHSKSLEEWKGEGVLINWWQANIYRIVVPKPIELRWAAGLQHLVEQWSGMELEQTMLYGIRQYGSNSRLLQHTDHLETHALSLIVNIEQGNLTQPWPVEVLDHGHRIHEIVLEPGDIVYYESAKNLHGRSKPLLGKDAYYVNLFTHYRPKLEGRKWYELPRNPDRPAPVGDDIKGTCHVPRIKEDDGTTLDDLVGQVVCDDKRLGSYISPTLFQAHGPEDLVKWWKFTTPPSEEDGKDEL